MTKYIVTCPNCGAKVDTEWLDIPPGGVSPVECGCGYWILSETEGNPVMVKRETK